MTNDNTQASPPYTPLYTIVQNEYGREHSWLALDERGVCRVCFRHLGDAAEWAANINATGTWLPSYTGPPAAPRAPRATRPGRRVHLPPPAGYHQPPNEEPPPMDIATKLPRLPRSQLLPDAAPHHTNDQGQTSRKAVADQAIARIEHLLATPITHARLAKTRLAALGYLALRSVQIELLDPPDARAALARAIAHAGLPAGIAAATPWPLTRQRLWIRLVQDANPTADQLLRFALHLATLVELAIYRSGKHWPQPVVATYLLTGIPPGYDAQLLIDDTDHLEDALKTAQEATE